MWRKWDWELVAIIVGLAAIALSVTGARLTPGVPAGGIKITHHEPVGPVVHVAGAVHRPGLYRLQPGDRVADAIAAAGGATADADANLLNLAAVVTDGMRLAVPGPGDDAGERDVTVNINRASASELDALPGIGPALAERIVAHRERHGWFSTIDALTGVPGIGPATVERLRPLVRVD